MYASTFLCKHFLCNVHTHSESNSGLVSCPGICGMQTGIEAPSSTTWAKPPHVRLCTDFFQYSIITIVQKYRHESLKCVITIKVTFRDWLSDLRTSLPSFTCCYGCRNNTVMQLLSQSARASTWTQEPSFIFSNGIQNVFYKLKD